MGTVSRGLVAGTVGLLVGSVTAVAPLAPAHADRVVVHDRTGDGLGRDGSNGDIEKVRVRHGVGAVSFVVTPAGDDGGAHFYDFWIDTDRRDPGPEFVATVSLEVDRVVSVSRAESFGDLQGAERCRRRTTRYDFDTQVLRTKVPRWCLGRPARIRVAVQASQEYGTTDWAPRRRAFTRWLRRD